MLASMGTPMLCGVTPYSASISSWPAAVAPPWLPIAGTMKGLRAGVDQHAERGLHNFFQVGNAAAAHAQGNPHARRDLVAQPGLRMN